MSFTVTVYCLFGLFAVFFVRHLLFMVKLIRRYKVGLPAILETLSEEDRTLVKKHNGELATAFRILLFLLIVAFIAEISSR